MISAQVIMLPENAETRSKFCSYADDGTQIKRFNLKNTIGKWYSSQRQETVTLPHNFQISCWVINSNSQIATCEAGSFMRDQRAAPKRGHVTQNSRDSLPQLDALKATTWSDTQLSAHDHHQSGQSRHALGFIHQWATLYSKLQALNFSQFQDKILTDSTILSIWTSLFLNTLSFLAFHMHQIPANQITPTRSAKTLPLPIRPLNCSKCHKPSLWNTVDTPSQWPNRSFKSMSWLISSGGSNACKISSYQYQILP
jgi:hypothetical protein